MSVDMATSRQLALRARELLGDGEWHDYERTLAALIRLVTPGRAIRVTEQSRVAAGGPPQRKRPRSIEAQIESGARRIATDFLRNPNAFEVTPGRKGAGHDKRQVRMIGHLRSENADPVIAERHRWQYETEMLRDQLDLLIAYLKDTGQADVVDRLITGAVPHS